jgi:hypothetical protein
MIERVPAASRDPLRFSPCMRQTLLTPVILSEAPPRTLPARRHPCADRRIWSSGAPPRRTGSPSREAPLDRLHRCRTRFFGRRHGVARGARIARRLPQNDSDPRTSGAAEPGPALHSPRAASTCMQPTPPNPCHSERGAAPYLLRRDKARAPTEESGRRACGCVGREAPRERPRSTRCTVAEPDSSVGAMGKREKRGSRGASLRMTATCWRLAHLVADAQVPGTLHTAGPPSPRRRTL